MTKLGTRVTKQAEEVAEHVETWIDGYIENLKNNDYNRKKRLINLLTTYKIKKSESKYLAQWFANLKDELGEAIDHKDPDLVEGYDFLTRPQLKKYRDMIQEIVDICNQHSKLSKAVRKPRRKKSQTPGKIIKKLQYCEKSDDYGISSIDPRKIVGANKVIVFNTKYNKLAIFEASPLVDGLSVKGTTIVGFDDKKSKERTVRKPQEIIKDCANSGIRVINNRYNSLTTKEKVPTGRINKHCVILQALK